MNYLIQKIITSDLNDIFEIEQKNYVNCWTLNQLLDEIDNPTAVSFKLVIDEIHIVGYIFSTLISDELSINNLSIDPAFHRYGFGLALLKHLLAIAKSKNTFTSYLEVRQSNISAIKLYKKLGFTIDYIRKKFYFDGENALVMSLKL
jgi:ribosomal-protein-alanine N-acetyltransferase